MASHSRPHPGNLAATQSNLSDKDQAFLDLLIHDYPQFRFCLNQKRFSFRFANPPAKSTIFVGPPQPYFALQTLHELGHALCGHQDYHTHIERLKIESAAWQRAKTVLKNYKSKAKSLQQSSDPSVKLSGKNLAKILPAWNQDYTEDSLDTYRDWLHAKSKCKKCGQTCYQTRDGKYHCPFCDTFCG
ncbi:hypothetical protein IK112_02870 [Candidatus Saccharibacteria bacterium]|nr:hypothetical protein [Candidatus Saccharibacteria bacterium]